MPRPPSTTASTASETASPVRPGRIERPASEVLGVVESHKVESGFEPRDGDVLVVCYPTAKIPLSKQYSMMELGGHRYTRSLHPGDDVVEQFDKIFGFLDRQAKKHGVAALREWNEELQRTSAGR